MAPGAGVRMIPDPHGQRPATALALRLNCGGYAGRDHLEGALGQRLEVAGDGHLGDGVAEELA